MKFSNCVKLYYNTKLVQVDGNSHTVEQEIVVKLQKQFLDNYFKPQSNSESLRAKTSEHKPFILLIEEQSNSDPFQLNKKISDYLEPVQNEVLHILFSSSSLSSSFKALDQVIPTFLTQP